MLSVDTKVSTDTSSRLCFRTANSGPLSSDKNGREFSAIFLFFDFSLDLLTDYNSRSSEDIRLFENENIYFRFSFESGLDSRRISAHVSSG